MMWQRIRSGVRWNVAERYALAVRAMNLKNVKSIVISLDPFHPGNRSLRNFWQAIVSPRIKLTNPKVRVKPEIRHDRKAPFFVADLVDGRKLVFKTESMPEADLVTHFNKLLGNPEVGKAGPWPKPNL